MGLLAEFCSVSGSCRTGCLCFLASFSRSFSTSEFLFLQASKDESSCLCALRFFVSVTYRECLDSTVWTIFLLSYALGTFLIMALTSNNLRKEAFIFLAHGLKQTTIHYGREGMAAGTSDSWSYQGRKQRVNRK